MNEPTQPGGASTTAQNDGAAVDESGGAPSNAPKRPQKDPALIRREEVFASLEAKIDAKIKQDNADFLRSASADPRAALLALEMEKEASGEAIAADGEDGTEYVAPIQPAPTPVARPAERVSNKGEDPLGKFVVRVDGKPMFKTTVDGREELIPLDRAQAQLQKLEAAEKRLQDAAKLQRHLEAREAAIREAEAAWKAKAAAPAPAPKEPEIDDAELANSLVRSLVSEPEDKAAAKMAEVFKTIRAATPRIDADALVQRATEMAVRTVAERNNERALKAGFDKFAKDYPDIVGDSDLFALADRKTNAIAEAHPDWDPSEVMNEAGRLTREWLTSIGAPTKAPAAAQSTNNRQQRKQNLVPMPSPRTARTAPAIETPTADSPSDYIAELRKQRGQA